MVTETAYGPGIAAVLRLEAKRASFLGIAEVFPAVLYAWPLRPRPQLT